MLPGSNAGPGRQNHGGDQENQLNMSSESGALTEQFQLGVADSIFADTGFNPEKTIQWAHEHNFSPVQIYLNPDRLRTPTVIKHLNTLARLRDFSLIAHAPGADLFNPSCHELIFATAHALLDSNVGWHGQKILVWHMDPEETLETHLDIHREICRAGLVSAPENYMNDVTPDSIVACLNILEGLWCADSVVPVPDLPRFFSIDDPVNLEAARYALNMAANQPLSILHIIDGVRPLIQREGWCPPGQGQCHWDTLWPEITGLLEKFAVILEYEDRINPVHAQAWLQKISDNTATP